VLREPTPSFVAVLVGFLDALMETTNIAASKRPVRRDFAEHPPWIIGFDVTAPLPALAPLGPIRLVEQVAKMRRDFEGSDLHDRFNLGHVVTR